MKHKPTVTIGIPAYNEEANIGNLLKILIQQKEVGIEIKQIIIVNDCSEDSTVGEILKISDKRILLLNNFTRSGQIYSQNLIFDRSDNDVVVLLEADTSPTSEHFVENLLQPMLRDNEVGLVQGNTVYAKPRTFVGRVLHRQIAVYEQYAAKERNKRAIFISGRGGRAFSQKVYKKLRWPLNVPEDTYASLWCQQRRILIAFQAKAICLFRLPESALDFRRAKQKTISGQNALRKYFCIPDIRSFYESSCNLVVRMFIFFMLTSPTYCLVYLFLKIYAEVAFISSSFSDHWVVAKSTKSLYEV